MLFMRLPQKFIRSFSVTHTNFPAVQEEKRVQRICSTYQRIDGMFNVFGVSMGLKYVKIGPISRDITDF